MESPWISKLPVLHSFNEGHDRFTTVVLNPSLIWSIINLFLLISPLFLKQEGRRGVTNEKKQFSETKTWISDSKWCRCNRTRHLKADVPFPLSSNPPAHPGLTRVIVAFGFLYLKSYAFWSITKQSLNLRIYLLYTFHSKCICRQKIIQEKG